MASTHPTQRGFTLTEMLVALSILMFGLTALAGSMMAGASQRRGSEMRFRAVHMVDRVFQQLREEYLPKHDPDAGPVPPITADQSPEVPGYPGMKYTAEFVADPDHPRVVLCRLRVSWREQGERVAEVFERVLVHEKPFSRRISQIQGDER